MRIVGHISQKRGGAEITPGGQLAIADTWPAGLTYPNCFTLMKDETQHG
jgi:hypothetical protein